MNIVFNSLKPTFSSVHRWADWCALCFIVWQMCIVSWKVACHVFHCVTAETLSILTVLTSLFGFYKHSVSGDECQ